MGVFWHRTVVSVCQRVVGGIEQWLASVREWLGVEVLQPVNLHLNPVSVTYLGHPQLSDPHLYFCPRLCRRVVILA